MLRIKLNLGNSKKAQKKSCLVRKVNLVKKLGKGNLAVMEEKMLWVQLNLGN
jgi:hypothetical protein